MNGWDWELRWYPTNEAVLDSSVERCVLLASSRLHMEKCLADGGFILLSVGV